MSDGIEALLFAMLSSAFVLTIHLAPFGFLYGPLLSLPFFAARIAVVERHCQEAGFAIFRL
jgi:hypothetical protein